MEYIVKVGFDDLQDNEYRYEPGDIYPREGIEPTEERINELSTENNKRGVQLITAIKTAKNDTEKAKEDTQKPTEATKKKSPAKANKKSS